MSVLENIEKGELSLQKSWATETVKMTLVEYLIWVVVVNIKTDLK